jgi:hypothetical protein
VPDNFTSPYGEPQLLKVTNVALYELNCIREFREPPGMSAGIIVERNDFVALLHELAAQGCPQEAAPSGDQDPHYIASSTRSPA